jgi:hypothetical protein
VSKARVHAAPVEFNTAKTAYQRTPFFEAAQHLRFREFSQGAVSVAVTCRLSSEKRDNGQRTLPIINDVRDRTLSAENFFDNLEFF